MSIILSCNIKWLRVFFCHCFPIIKDNFSNEYLSYKLVTIVLVLHGVWCLDHMLHLVLILPSLGFFDLGLKRWSASRISKLFYILES